MTTPEGAGKIVVGPRAHAPVERDKCSEVRPVTSHGRQNYTIFARQGMERDPGESGTLVMIRGTILGTATSPSAHCSRTINET